MTRGSQTPVKCITNNFAEKNIAPNDVLVEILNIGVCDLVPVLFADDGQFITGILNRHYPG